ncbi:MAG: D-tyrosyl-tRNA(Tyr) deacylase [Myxococcaceae bacterium]|nr:D-tyrosyl-tRNA(Tyr) deacylase [Myxococcaceae bacterium]
MIALIQRVSRAHVEVNGETIATVGRGLLALIGVEAGDSAATATRLLERVLAYRVFPDAEGRMNLDLRQIGGGLLLVPQFTLAADTSKGNRPGFSTTAAPAVAESLFRLMVEQARALHPGVQAGAFGADMQVSLVNDGPATFNLRVPPIS